MVGVATAEVDSGAKMYERTAGKRGSDKREAEMVTTRWNSDERWRR